MYYLYVIQAEVDGSYYVGYTRDVKERLRRHNEGWTKSTKSKVPWKLVYTEAYQSKTDAIKREKQLKSWKSHKQIDRLVFSQVEGRPE